MYPSQVPAQRVPMARPHLQLRGSASDLGKPLSSGWGKVRRQIKSLNSGPMDRKDRRQGPSWCLWDWHFAKTYWHSHACQVSPLLDWFCFVSFLVQQQHMSEHTHDIANLFIQGYLEFLPWLMMMRPTGRYEVKFENANKLFSADCHERWGGRCRRNWRHGRPRIGHARTRPGCQDIFHCLQGFLSLSLFPIFLLLQVPAGAGENKFAYGGEIQEKKLAEDVVMWDKTIFHTDLHINLVQPL